MKLFKNMISRKPDHEETVGKIDLDMDVEPLRRRSDLLADDSGTPNRAARANSKDALYANPAKSRSGLSEEPEEVAGAGWGANAWGGDDWDDDDDWGDDDERDDLDDDGPSKSAAPSGGRTWDDDSDFGRKAIARSQLAASGDAEDRILQKTNSKMVDRESSRRHSAMAHLKKAAAATKADRILKDSATRDPSADPEEQSPYRDDLAKVVRPRTTSRPTSRSHSRPQSMTPPWDAAEIDEEALKSATEAEAAPDDFGFGSNGTGFDDPTSRFADDPTQRLTTGADRFSAEESAFARSDDDDDDSDAGTSLSDLRAAIVPDDLSEDDFADDDDPFNAFSKDRFESADAAAPETDEDDEDTFEAPTFASADIADDDAEDDFDGPVPSSAVSEAIALANAPDEPEEVDPEYVRRKIWDLAGDAPVVRDPVETRRQMGDSAPAPTPAPAQPAASNESVVNLASVAPTVTGRAGRSAGRVKTRLLGFEDPDDVTTDMFDQAKSVAPAAQAKYPVGWIIVVDGPGYGSYFTLFNGVSQIGRGEDQAVRLDFGDTSISRNNHAAVAFDDEQTKFFLGHGGKSNLVRMNGKPVLSTEELSDGDLIRIGETSLKFVSLCGESFNWGKRDEENAENGENA